MKLQSGWARPLKITLSVACAGFLLFIIPGVARQQQFRDPLVGDRPEAEFHMARLMYRTNRYAGSHGYSNPMWAVDYPLAEAHFLSTLRRYTKIDVSENTRHLELGDERMFKFPFLWLQQPAAGGWNPTKKEVEFLREYLVRGGFLMVDDFHGDNEWNYFEEVMHVVLPDKTFVDIPESNPLMHIFFDIDQDTRIPGDRHLRGCQGDPTVGIPHWRAIYDDHGRMIVMANHNMDIGDAWEHADDPGYPLPMTAFAYQLGVNYVLYAMSH